MGEDVWILTRHPSKHPILKNKVIDEGYLNDDNNHR